MGCCSVVRRHVQPLGFTPSFYSGWPQHSAEWYCVVDNRSLSTFFVQMSNTHIDSTCSLMHLADIGGYAGGNPTDPDFRELIVRWFEFGVTCPLFRQVPNSLLSVTFITPHT